MEFPVISGEQIVGNCTVTEDGLYWIITCACRCRSGEIVRLYCGSRNLGVLVPERGQMMMHRRLSKASTPEVPPVNGVFSLEPMELPVPWEGELEGIHCQGFLLGQTLLFPYEKEKPCPCEPMFCFFEIRDGFWRIAAEKMKTAD